MNAATTAALRILPEAGCCALSLCAASLLTFGFYPASSGVLPLCAAVLGGSFAAWLALWWRRPAWSLAILVAPLLLIIGFLYRSAGTTSVIDTVGLVFQDAVHAPGRLLTVGVPADATPALVLAPVTLFWAGSVAAVLTCGLTRAILSPALPALAVLVVAGLLVGPVSTLANGAAGGWLVPMITLALLRAARNGSVEGPLLSTARPAATALTAIAVLAIALTGAALAPLGRSEERFDLRSSVPVPLRVQKFVSPLAVLKQELTRPPVRLFRVEVSTGVDPTLDRVRVVALERYDGSVWSSSPRFYVAGHNLRPVVPGSDTVRLRVHIGALPGPLLPVGADPQRLDADRMQFGHLGFDRRGQMLVSDQSVTGLTYTVTGRRQSRASAALTAATPEPSAGPELLAVPTDLPQSLLELDRQLQANPGTPWERLKRTETTLRQLPTSLAVPAGSSLAALNRMLQPADPDARLGFSEQHATAFALLARLAGFPTRVAVGYLLRRPQGSTFDVSSRDAHAWPEVQVAGQGWVAFEPTDLTRIAPPPRSPVTALSPSSPLQAPPTPGAGASPVLRVDLHTADGTRPLSPNPSPHPPQGGGGHIDRHRCTSYCSCPTDRCVEATAAQASEADRVGSPTARWRMARGTRSPEGAGPPSPASPHAARGRSDGSAQLNLDLEPLERLAPLATASVYSGKTPDEKTVHRAWLLEREVHRSVFRGPHGGWQRWLSHADPRPLLRARPWPKQKGDR